MYTRMVIIVICKLCQRREVVIVTLKFENTIPQHVFKNLDCTLKLAISMRLESCVKFQLVLKSPLKPRSELSTPIWYNIERHTMKMNHLTNVEVRANLSLLNEHWIEGTRADLVNSSMMTQMISTPLEIWGKPPKKYIVIRSHFHPKMGNL